ncbi:hypothetical protein MRBLWO14_001634 [Microbacterium sp. LWO14-1.2]|uniref:hypothetical protein n=1 Tax=Microbacterium sp. LWO14-1.2 TaxID=3135263 RepID=UPI003138CAF4
MSRRRKTTIAWTAATLLVIAGLAATVVGLMTPVSFGWFAYQPLSSATFVGDGSGFFVSRTTAIGFVLLALGFVALAFLAGLRLGGRRPDAAAPDA